jgi:hypothetical protein
MSERVNRVCFTPRPLFLVYPNQRTSHDPSDWSGSCRYCCKSRKSSNPKNFAKVDLWTSLLLRRFSTPLRRSVIDFGENDKAPHVDTLKTHQRLQEFSFATPKRLLQQNLPIRDISLEMNEAASVGGLFYLLLWKG